MATANEPNATPPTLQDKINVLVELPLPPEFTSDSLRSPDSVGERVRAIATAAGISESLLNALRLGQRDNPTKATMQKLADLYKVDPAYFTDGALGTEIYRQLRLLQTLAEIKKGHTPQLKVAFRNHFELSDKGATTALQMLEQLRDLEAQHQRPT
ncbi:helix-turn-helix transcriptional regulator [Micromonospora sp. WMMA1363]|uniref:helix-turn-helix domain-containing protein n=1 Tax=Micromonospora sp. WMMA1363 TaxID=3053985 RepID=UPI00259CCA9B|nr:helix-turn-helix transcriptional regulator [Micromonospora sp. WMMA1363]MDM4723304.1 helix-turn-helix transcriptional regulator [Micromonospora sp. WMMA1363]MDM4723400.1 helix-turn-helix transcriptional regulator [Micromonospora sp. WMMA1363]